ncbi:MAG: hypothetical protein ACHP7N_01440 [Caulobacterales bacterium]
MGRKAADPLRAPKGSFGQKRPTILGTKRQILTTSNRRNIRVRSAFGPLQTTRLRGTLGASFANVGLQMLRKRSLSKAWVVASLLLAASGASQAQQSDHMVLGPDQFKFDQTRSGAVLCAWSMYLETQAATKACGLTRGPADDAIDRAILDIDGFIIANSSLHPTRAALEEFKRRTNDAFIRDLRSRSLRKFCEGPDLEAFRAGSPAGIASSVRALLAKPREPVMNPCL